jgi:glycosyltransferase involved in cell wall biosynthesis
VHGYLDDEQLPGIYAAASAYVDVSLYEGFGLHTLEAMASGTPVIATDIPAIAEVVGSAGHLFPAGDAERLQRLLESVLYGGERERLASEGRKRAACFSWHETARSTVDAYSAVLAKARE